MKAEARFARYLRRFAGLVAGIAVMIAVLPGPAQGAGAAPVTVSNARIRLLPGDLPLAGYLDIRNDGAATITLTGAASPAFGMVHLHLSRETNGTATMVTVEGVDIEPGATVRIAPGGFHLMLMGRTHPLKVGDRVPITLKFRDGRAVEADFEVRGADTQ